MLHIVLIQHLLENLYMSLLYTHTNKNVLFVPTWLLVQDYMLPGLEKNFQTLNMNKLFLAFT